MKSITCLLFTVMCVNTTIAKSFLRDSLRERHTDTNTNNSSFLNQNDLEFISNGFIRSATEVLKFNVGHPEKFNIPFYLIVGANVNIKNQNTFNNSLAIFDLLNNMGGLFNFGVNGVIPVIKKANHVNVSCTYQAGAKSINTIISEKNSNNRHLAYFGLVGIKISATAWQSSSSKSVPGSFWIKNVLGYTHPNHDNIFNVWPELNHSFFINHIFEAGLNLTDGIHLKLGLYQFLNNRDTPFVNEAQYKITAKMQLNN